jgi:hypothetical protein
MDPYCRILSFLDRGIQNVSFVYLVQDMPERGLL